MSTGERFFAVKSRNGCCSICFFDEAHKPASFALGCFGIKYHNLHQSPKGFEQFTQLFFLQTISMSAMMFVVTCTIDTTPRFDLRSETNRGPFGHHPNKKLAA